jgi:hypothetical protein
MLPFPNTNGAGTDINDTESSAWAEALTEVKEAGFANADLTDSWVRPGDLSRGRLAELKQTAEDVGIGLPALSAIRRSVIEQGNWQANLAYSHRTIDAAAELGCEVVSFGLHQAITPKQREQLWFWTVEDHKDPSGNKETWGNAVTRLRELGRHADSRLVGDHEDVHGIGKALTVRGTVDDGGRESICRDHQNRNDSQAKLRDQGQSDEGTQELLQRCSALLPDHPDASKDDGEDRQRQRPRHQFAIDRRNNGAWPGSPWAWRPRR